jgi:serine phosphatase RsbU (regulator of sigma subunit)
MCDHIFEHVDQFQTGAVQHDDMALLVVKANAGR